MKLITLIITTLLVTSCQLSGKKINLADLIAQNPAQEPTAIAKLDALGNFPDDCEWQKTFFVVDGDTLSTKKGKIRLIGIDTPEVKGPFTEEEPFGKEASAYMRLMLKDEERICLRKDPNVANTDKYDRYLRYIYTQDGTNINSEMVKEGYAKVFAVENFFFEGQWRDIQKEAKKWERGLWKK